MSEVLILWTTLIERLYATGLHDTFHLGGFRTLTSFFRNLAAVAALSLPAAFAQGLVPGQVVPAITANTPDAYQVNYASNLNLGDGVINITNGGASAGSNTPIINANNYGDICANVYVYAPDQELASCCTCLVSPNSLHSFPVSFGPGNLLQNVNNTTVMASINASHSVVIKLVATATTSANSGTCSGPTQPGALVSGMVAWGTHSHPTNTPSVAITETPFVPTPLSVGEATKLTGDCFNSLTAGSGQQCPGCRTGGLSLATTLD
jgi:hypothetical protein